jgi:protein ImuB
MRVACVYAPQLALQAVLRRDPELRQDAVVLVEAGATDADRARVVGLTRAAHQAGMRRGMTVSQARARGAAPGHALRVMVSAEADTAAAQAALCDVGFAFAPRVEAEAGRIFLEVGDLARMYPGGGAQDGAVDERAVAQGIVAHAARVGLAVRVTIASSKAVARVGSEASDLALVPAGGERAFLAPLPVRHALGAWGGAKPKETAAEAATLSEALDRWGIRTLGALAALPLGEVGLRLGEAGARLHKIAAAAHDEPFVPAIPADALEEGTELEYALYELEPLAFILRGLVDRALERLGCRGLGCAGLTVRLKLEPHGYEVREIPLGAPTREAATLLQLARLELGRRPPAAPVIGLALLVLPARVRAVQLDFLRPAGPAPERLAATLARLAALVGLENVGVPAAVDTYREEAVALAPFIAQTEALAAPTASPALAFRRFRPPQHLEVLMGREGPTALRGPDTTARVLVAAGPYRASGEWWSSDGWSRDYWDLQASDGAVYRVHQDRTDGRWYLDGYYD